MVQESVRPQVFTCELRTACGASQFRSMVWGGRRPPEILCQLLNFWHDIPKFNPRPSDPQTNRAEIREFRFSFLDYQRMPGQAVAVYHEMRGSV